MTARSTFKRQLKAFFLSDLVRTSQSLISFVRIQIYYLQNIVFSALRGNLPKVHLLGRLSHLKFSNFVKNVKKSIEKCFYSFPLMLQMLQCYSWVDFCIWDMHGCNRPCAHFQPIHLFLNLRKYFKARFTIAISFESISKANNI